VVVDAENDEVALRLAEPHVGNKGRGFEMRNGSSARWCETGEDLVRLYLHDISPYPLLTRDDEVRLARRIEAGMAARAELEVGMSRGPDRRRRLEERARDGDVATQEFVNANLRLVVSIARTYRTSGLSLLDVVQEGNLGLIHAVKKFDWRKGFKFSTYATWWIRQAINRGLAHSGRTIRLPVQAVERLTRLFKARERLEAKLGRTPSLEELAAETNMGEQDVERVLRSSPHVRSLSDPTGAQSKTELGEFIVDESAPEPFEQAARSLTVAEVERVLGTLEPQERRVLRLRFGLDGDTPRTFGQLAAQLDLPCHEVRVIEARALAKLRHPCMGYDLHDLIAAS
jgi:RNA polymerase sigma factor (sigma-70 family)